MLRPSKLKALKAQYMELQNLRELVRAAEEKSDLRFGDRRNGPYPESKNSSDQLVRHSSIQRKAPSTVSERD